MSCIDTKVDQEGAPGAKTAHNLTSISWWVERSVVLPLTVEYHVAVRKPSAQQRTVYHLSLGHDTDKNHIHDMRIILTFCFGRRFVTLMTTSVLRHYVSDCSIEWDNRCRCRSLGENHVCWLLTVKYTWEDDWTQFSKERKATSIQSMFPSSVWAFNITCMYYISYYIKYFILDFK